MFDWNDLRFFLELQRSGRLLSAAKRLNTTHSTVARHIESIEQSLGTALFVQHAQGYELTPSGQALLKHAEAMENVALLAQEEITQAITPLGKIRLGVTEGIGIMFFTPRMNALFERYPGLEVELVAVPRFVSILNREAEISIHLERPSADLLITRKLTDYRLALYASQAYLDRAPPLRNREDLARDIGGDCGMVDERAGDVAGGPSAVDVQARTQRDRTGGGLTGDQRANAGEADVRRAGERAGHREAEPVAVGEEQPAR